MKGLSAYEHVWPGLFIYGPQDDGSYVLGGGERNIAKGRQVLVHVAQVLVAQVLEAQVLGAQTLVAQVLVENETLQKGAKCLYRAVGSWR